MTNPDNRAVRVYGKTAERKHLARAARRQQDKSAEREGTMDVDEVSPTGWWYMSFATVAQPDGFLGGLYIDGETIAEAITRSHVLGLNPGGQVAFVAVPARALADVPMDMRRRLLTREEVEST